MYMLAFLIGLFGFPVCLVLLIIKAIRKKPKLKVLIAMAVCFALFVLGVCLFPSQTKEVEVTPTPTTEHTNLSFELIAGEPSEYGELFTINKGTEFEETYYIYRIPSGSYTVTNSGEYMNAFYIYGEKIYKTDAGWEELSDIFYEKLLDVGESDSFTIADGQIIEIHEPGRFILEKTA